MKYRERFEKWDWNEISRDAEECIDEEGIRVRTYYLGSVFTMTPSGKYYMPWCSNFTYEEAAEDAEWFEDLVSVAEKYGAYITSGEGDPTDLYATFPVDD